MDRLERVCLSPSQGLLAGQVQFDWEPARSGDTLDQNGIPLPVQLLQGWSEVATGHFRQCFVANRWPDAVSLDEIEA